MTDRPITIPRIRPIAEADGPQIMELLSQTLGWHEDDRHSRLFAWKHRENPFGRSPTWVAEDEQGVVGFRALMRWEFLSGGETIRAVRAVDTATAPRAQGRGVFRALTLRAVDDMTSDGVAWVFNTPNSQSAPGYLSMGWQYLGRVRLAFRPANLRVLPKLYASRAPGELWSLPTSVGEPAMGLLSEAAELHELLEEVGSGAGVHDSLATRKTSVFLTWRYGRCPVGYRGVLVGSRISEGLILFRLRRRGTATELVISEVITAPGTTPAQTRATLSRLLEVSGADYAVALGECRPPGWLPVPRTGPSLTWRRLAWTGPVPTIDMYRFCTGDIELF